LVGDRPCDLLRLRNQTQQAAKELLKPPKKYLFLFYLIDG
jgi:hypothetical protein